jgi:hypothetical protein
MLAYIYIYIYIYILRVKLKLLPDGDILYMVDANIFIYLVVFWTLKKLFTSIFLPSYGTLSSKLCIIR